MVHEGGSRRLLMSLIWLVHELQSCHENCSCHPLFMNIHELISLAHFIYATLQVFMLEIVMNSTCY